jgi:hypothetical protein
MKDNKWDARLKAMKERQAAIRQQSVPPPLPHSTTHTRHTQRRNAEGGQRQLQQQDELSPLGKTRSLSTALPGTTEEQPAASVAGRSSAASPSARYSLPPTLVPSPTPVSDKLSTSGSGITTKAGQQPRPEKRKQKGNISRLSAFFGGSSKKASKD